MKNWIDLNAQVQKHVDRGLDLGDVPFAKFALFLYSSNYYRVSGYARCFYEAATGKYIAGTTAAQLMDIYDLDRAIRNLVLDGVGVVEPTLRSRVAFHVAKVIGGGGRSHVTHIRLRPGQSDRLRICRLGYPVNGRRSYRPGAHGQKVSM